MTVRPAAALAFALACALGLAACSKSATDAQKAQAAPLLVSAEDLAPIRNSALTSGPVITGSIQPERRADLRAEVQAIVLQVLKEHGDGVKRGDALVRLDDNEILQVIDATSMRFEGLVGADDIGQVKAGQGVHFRVHGYGVQEFAGKVRSVNPAANATTRQVEVLVDFVGDKQPKLAGLYAEGRLETQSRVSLTVPSSAIVRDGDKVSAYRVRDGKLQKVVLKVGDRDPRSGDYVVVSGLDEGDQVIRYPTTALREGQAVQAAVPAKSSMAVLDDGASQP